MKPKLKLTYFIVFSYLFYSISVQAQMEHESHSQSMSPKDCSDMMIWDFKTASCQPLAMSDMKMSMWMVHGNAFLVQDFSEAPRGRNNFSVPNMLMADSGTSFGGRHYFNLNLMLTFEKWTFPDKGYPELLQIGERDSNDKPYIDAQHPHSSPIMGITLSDTIRLGGDKENLKLFFAPRGQPTDGPIAFMHRSTGMINPDAPLGHHIGQDVSHITSTVWGASLGLGKTHYEISVFNGEEPEPTKVDLPLGKLNSFAARFIHEITENLYGMVSGSYLKDPEPHDPTLRKINRYSASLYYDKKFPSMWMFHNSLIFGQVHSYDHISKLRSFNEEFLLHSMELPHNIWGRLEVLERGADELKITSSNSIKWVQAITLGYTYDLWKNENYKVGIGSSITKNLIPSQFENDYGKDPLAGKIFIQLMGMKMGSFN